MNGYLCRVCVCVCLSLSVCASFRPVQLSAQKGFGAIMYSLFFIEIKLQSTAQESSLISQLTSG